MHSVNVEINFGLNFLLNLQLTVRDLDKSFVLLIKKVTRD